MTVAVTLPERSSGTKTLANFRIPQTLTGGLIILSTATPVAATDLAKCTSGWSGSANYTRHFASNTSKSGPRISGDGTETQAGSITSDYAAQFAVRAGAEPGTSVARANIRYTSNAAEMTSASVQSRCANEHTLRTMTGQTTSETRVQAGASGTEADVSVSLNDDGTYSVGVGTPEVSGMVSGSTSSKFSGQCSHQPDRSGNIGEMPTSIQGYTFQSDGTNRVDQRDPSQLSGSYSVTNFGVTETLKWDLRRCAGSVQMVDLKFEDMKFPTWDAWQTIADQNGTIDGNQVRITAIIANDGDRDEAVTVRFKESEPSGKVAAAKLDPAMDEQSIDVPAGQRRELRFIWDTSGYAWYDDGRPRFSQKIRAELINRGKTIGEKEGTLKIAPKPVVLVHGLWSDWRAFDRWQTILSTSHSFAWKPFPVGEKPEHGAMDTGGGVGNFGKTNTILENSQQLAQYIDYAQRDRNAWHVDLVAHSMGGLISRRYIHDAMPTYYDGKPQVSHLVMLGTPNMGSPCADVAGWVATFLRMPATALKQLRTDDAALFNRLYINRRGVPFSILAGDPLPVMCKTPVWNDGVVPVESAMWQIADRAKSSNIHTALTGSDDFLAFVKPRLALGPKAAHESNGEDASFSALDSAKGALSSSARGRAAGARTAGNTSPNAQTSKALSAPSAASPDSAGPINFAKALTMSANEKIVVPIPVAAGANLNMLLMAPSTVSATLSDAQGNVVATNQSGKPEASQPFRMLVVDKPIAKGQWSLSLTNQGPVTQEAMVGSWSDTERTPQ